MIGNAPDWCTCGAIVRDEGDRWICEGCLFVIRECVCAGGAKHVRKDGVDNKEESNVGSNVRELKRSHAVFTKEYNAASLNLLRSLENIIYDQEAEIHRLSEEQIKPLADFLMQQSDAIGHPGDEAACAMAIRVISELISKEEAV